MSIRKTLGGDRLGSGKKMEVELHNYARSTHDMSYLWRSTMSSGTLVPFCSQILLPGDTWDINLDSKILTHPTVGPLFGSFKAQYDMFLCPIRLYQGKLHNNKLGIGMDMNSVKLPIMIFQPRVIDIENIPEDLDNCQINPSCILAYLGLRGIGIAVDTNHARTRSFNAVSLLSYWDIYKNYYSNKQEEIGFVIHNTNPVASTDVNVIEIFNPGSVILTQNGGSNSLVNTPITIVLDQNAGVQALDQVFMMTDKGDISFAEIGPVIIDAGAGGNVTFRYNLARWGTRTFMGWRYADNATFTKRTIQLQSFPLSHIDDMREAILADTTNAAAFELSAAATTLQPYRWLFETTGLTTSIMNTQEGLGIKTYQSDLFNNWLSTEWIDGTNGISEVTAIDTTGGSFTIDTLNLSKKVYDMLNRIAVSGGTYDDWLDAVYTENRYTRAESPIYMGGMSKELIFQEVISNSESAPDNGGGTQPVGTLAGRGTLGSKHKGGHIVVKVDEPSYLVGIVSLTPRIDYSQGNQWDLHLETMDDLHKPALDEIGFQELITEQMAWWSTNRELTSANYVTRSAGKQPAWINYMTNVNKVLGNFAIESNEMFMVLNRKYTPIYEDDAMQIDDLTTYIDPTKFNHIFAETSLDSQNFWVQIAVDITARRKISAKLMPNL